MLEFGLLIIAWLILMRIPAGRPEPPKYDYDDGTWKFKSLDDALEFRELRASGWRGDMEAFYKLKEEEES